MARRRASSTLEAGSPRDYPEHLNPFHDDAEDDVQLRGGADDFGRSYGTLGRLRRRASFSSTWSMLTMRRSRPPSAPPAPDSAVAVPRRRLRFTEIQSWLSLSPRRRSRSASASPAPQTPSPQPPRRPAHSPRQSPAQSPTQSYTEPFVLSPRTHRYRDSPPTPPEETARRAALRLYGPQAVPRSPSNADGSDRGGDIAPAAPPAGPLPPLRIEEPPEQPLRAQEAVRRAQATVAVSTAPPPRQTSSPDGRAAEGERAMAERPPRPLRPPRVRKRPAPPPPISARTTSVASTAVDTSSPAPQEATVFSESPSPSPSPPAVPPTPPATPPASPPPSAPSAANAAASEDSAPEADQTPSLESAPTPAPRFQEKGDAKPAKEAEGEERAAAAEGEEEDGSPRVPPRKPRRASAADALSTRVLPSAQA